MNVNSNKTMMTVDEMILAKLHRRVETQGIEDRLELWQMSSAEKAMMVSILSAIQPSVAIEIGTAQGGSLCAIAAYAKHVYSVDIDKNSQASLSRRFPEVSFISGNSQKKLPPLLDNLNRREMDLEFVLIDGDHSREGVRRDIEVILDYHPRSPLVILMHDSFNPYCRLGMRDANWENSPYVHMVELDLVPGITLNTTGKLPEMWGGLGVALLFPEMRQSELQINERNKTLFDKMIPHSVYANCIDGYHLEMPIHNPSSFLYAMYVSASETELLSHLERSNEPSLIHNDEFLCLRPLLLSKLKIWKAAERRVAIYGIGQHTNALLGLIPELYPLVKLFIDQKDNDMHLNRICIRPDQFKGSDVDVVIYSSRAFEDEMFFTLKNYNVEHILLYR